MRIEDVLTIGRNAQAKADQVLPKGRLCVVKAFQLGKEVAAEAIYEALMKEKSPYFWTVQPEDFKPR